MYSLDQVSYELRLLLDVLIYHSFSAQDIMKSHKKFGFNNNRYIKADNYKEWITTLIENGYVKITPATEYFSFLTVEQLKSVLRLLHLPTSGKKQELIARISNQAGTENALKELNLYVERFVLTDIGREAVESIPPQEPYPKKDRLTLIMEMKEGLEKIRTKWYKIYATPDDKTCPLCREMEGKKFRMSDFQVGVTAPPFHDDCNCSIGPTTPDNKEDEDELDRIWREVREEIKKTNTLSEKERFEKWKEKFVYGDKSEADVVDKSEEQRKQLENSGAEKYEILATLDMETCDQCGKMDGKIFDLKDYKPGITAPPFHDGCRCTTTPHLDEDLWEDLKDERIARGKDGKTYYVPGDMTYSQWRKTIQ